MLFKSNYNRSYFSTKIIWTIITKLESQHQNPLAEQYSVVLYLEKVIPSWPTIPIYQSSADTIFLTKKINVLYSINIYTTDL